MRAPLESWFQARVERIVVVVVDADRGPAHGLGDVGEFVAEVGGGRDDRGCRDNGG
jgi:hypothetical protein